MRKYILLFAIITLVFIVLGFIIKSKYYYFPYPNLIEYFLSFVLLIITLVSLIRKSKADLKAKLLTGLASIVILMAIINFLNFTFKWHPLTLNPPFSKSQSFEVSYEPYEWETETPEKYGYDNKVFSTYFDKLDEWDRLRGLLIVKDDKLIIEKYFSGSTKRSAFNIHSVTKSITSALVGLAIQYDYIKSEDELVLPFFSEYQNNPFGDFKKALTIKHLLSMRGGWAGADGFQTVEQCVTKEYLHVMPDSEFKYFTGSQNILSAIVSKSTGQSTKEFADKVLFAPLGIKNGFWREVDGYYVGGDESYYTARDLARVGELFLKKGNIDGKQVLDSAWIDKTFANYTNTSKEFRSLESYDEVGYGFCWWILRTKDNRTIYAARGKGGQHIILIPDKKIIAVIIQEWNPLKKNEIVENKLLGELLSIL
jgi:CubicO group peptidase (beta-lactamase class C family)